MTVVDLFAGSGGWDLGARAIGLDPWGIECWAPAIATRRAAVLRTVEGDLADPTILRSWYLGDIPPDGLIASPPCPDWSTAGSRAKRDGKTGWLVDVPMAWARALTPRWIALEQVPPALEVWEVNADELRAAGYSVWTGILNAANYGVPQTRERAFLLASLDRPALPPEPTHARAPEPSLFGPQLKRWVSMADALGIGGGDRPAQTLTAKSGGQWHLNPGKTETQPNRRVRPVDEPAPTIAFGHDAANWRWDLPATTVTGDPRLSERCSHRDGGQSTGPRLTIEQAAILQTFPPDYPWQGSKGDQFKQVGNAVPPLLAERILRALAG